MMLLPQVLDASVALVAEGYQSLGADWWDALEKAQGAGEQAPPEGGPVEKTEEQKVAENNETLANIMGALGGSTFRGPKG
jgi:hypothetical protein